MSRSLACTQDLLHWQVSFSPWEWRWRSSPPRRWRRGRSPLPQPMPPFYPIYYNHSHCSSHPCCYHCHHPSIIWTKSWSLDLHNVGNEPGQGWGRRAHYRPHLGCLRSWGFSSSCCATLLWLCTVLEWLWRRKERPDSTSRQGKRLELASMYVESQQLESEVQCSQSPSLVTSTAVHWQLR